MDNRELIATVLRFAIEARTPPSKLWIGGVGAMLLHGLRTECKGVIVHCNQYTFNSILKVYNRTPINVGREQGFQYDNTSMLPFPEHCIQLVVDRTPWERELTSDNGVRYYTLRQLLKQKEAMGREKDQPDIQLLRRVLGGGQEVLPTVSASPVPSVLRHSGNSRRNAA